MNSRMMMMMMSRVTRELNFNCASHSTIIHLQQNQCELRHLLKYYECKSPEIVIRVVFNQACLTEWKRFLDQVHNSLGITLFSYSRYEELWQ